MFAARENLKSTELMYFASRVLALVVVCAALPNASKAQTSLLTNGRQMQRLEQQQKGMAAEERQKKMESDAARLVEMAQQLKASVDKTNKDVLSVDVIKEAERIEKLAREVRDGMRQ